MYDLWIFRGWICDFVDFLLCSVVFYFLVFFDYFSPWVGSGQDGMNSCGGQSLPWHPNGDTRPQGARLVSRAQNVPHIHAGGKTRASLVQGVPTPPTWIEVVEGSRSAMQSDVTRPPQSSNNIHLARTMRDKF